MRPHTEIMSLAPAPIPSTRGVHSYVEQPRGQTVYFAITSTGELLNGELRRRHDDETEAQLLRDMLRDLARQDPVTLRDALVLYVDGVPRPARRRPWPPASR